MNQAKTVFLLVLLTGLLLGLGWALHNDRKLVLPLVGALGGSLRGLAALLRRQEAAEQ